MTRLLQLHTFRKGVRFSELIGLQSVAALALMVLASCSNGLPRDVADAYQLLPDDIDFNAHVRPILSNRCFSCHGPDEKARKAGLRLDQEEQAFAVLESGGHALVRNQPDQSTAVTRVLSDDPEIVMPPPESKNSLTAIEKATLVKWLEQGAPCKGHWSFLPPEKCVLPQVETEQLQNPIDHFVLDQLQQEGWSFSPPADKRTLIRRIYLDLIGLPPSLEEVHEQGSRPSEYVDYQELLEQDNLQAVIIATQPHWHALQFVTACQRGLDIYCCKPLSYDIHEGLAMIKAAEKADNVVQVGFMQRSNVVGDKIRSLIEEGRLGNIHQIGAQINYNPNPGDTTIQKPPASLDWETWCGPAPNLPYRPSIGHFNWRLEKEYGNGHLVDWGIHYIDYLRMALDLDMPTSVDAMGDILVHKGAITTPDTLQARMDFEDYPIIWSHRMWGAGDLNPDINSGYTFYGDEATMYGDFKRLVIQPKGKNQPQEIIEVPTKGALVKDLVNFLEAVNLQDKTHVLCPVEDGFKSTAAVQLAMISYYTGSKVDWDAENQTIPNHAEAAKLLARPYRGDYQRPKV